MIYAIIATVILFMLARYAIAKAEQRREHKNRSEGAKRGWVKRKGEKAMLDDYIEGEKQRKKWVGKENNE